MTRKRLDSWKEIATYLNRTVRTVLRWSRTSGLPVHRVPGPRRRSVYAFSDELDSWLFGNRGRADPASAIPAAAPGQEGAISEAAQMLYRKARYLWDARVDITESIRILREVIAEEPRYALAYAGLADAFIVAAIYGALHPHEAFHRARHAAAQALRIEPGLTEANCSEAWVQLCQDRNWAGADAAFTAVLEAQPDYTFARTGRCYLLLALGKADTALAAAREAWARDPISPAANVTLCQCLYFDRQFAEAVRHAQQTLVCAEGHLFVHIFLAFSLLQLGRQAEAIRHLELARNLFGEVPIVIGALGLAHALSGQSGKAREFLQALIENRGNRHVPAFAVALPCVGLGRWDLVLANLEQASEQRSHWNLFLRAEPLFDELRTDSRYVSLIDSFGFPVVSGEAVHPHTSAKATSNPGTRATSKVQPEAEQKEESLFLRSPIARS